MYKQLYIFALQHLILQCSMPSAILQFFSNLNFFYSFFKSILCYAAGGKYFSKSCGSKVYVIIACSVERKKERERKKEVR
ncbi:MAG: hypothetical protein U5M23_09660 [Marinagarivorans sp.]|nr:hypothetical protein [Marinagarivorans sp.]